MGVGGPSARGTFGISASREGGALEAGTRIEGRHTRLGPLLRRDFLVFVLARSGSRMGDAFFDLALTWSVYAGTGSALAAAGITVFDRLAAFFTYLVAGVLADRWDRRRILLAGDLARAAVVAVAAVLAWRGALTPAVAYATVSVLQVLGVVFGVTATAVVPRLVPAQALVAAQGVFAAAVHAADIAGRAVAGAAIAVLGTAGALLVDAASFLLGAAGTAALRIPWGSPRTQGSARRGVRAWLRDLRQGWSAAAGHPAVRGVMVCAMLANVVAVHGVVPATAERLLGGGPAVYGVLQAASVAGAIAGGFAAGPLDRRFGAGRLFALALTLLAAASAGIGIARHAAAAAVLFFASGLASGLVGPPTAALIQARVPEGVLGRVFGALGAAANLLMPAGALAAGGLADALGPGPVWLASGGWLLLVAALAWANPHLRGARVG